MVLEERRSLMLRGVLDLCVLALLEQEAVYGYEVVQKLADCGLEVADGSVYPLLARLQRSELVASELRAGTGGPPRRYHLLTEQGSNVLAEGRAVWGATAAAVDGLLRPASTCRPSNQLREHSDHRNG